MRPIKSRVHDYNVHFNMMDNEKITVFDLDVFTGELVKDRVIDFKVGEEKCFYKKTKSKKKIIVEIYKIYRFKEGCYGVDYFKSSKEIGKKFTYNVKHKEKMEFYDFLKKEDKLKYIDVEGDNVVVSYESKVIGLIEMLSIMDKNMEDNFNINSKESLETLIESIINLWLKPIRNFKISSSFETY